LLILVYIVYICDTCAASHKPQAQAQASATSDDSNGTTLHTAHGHAFTSHLAPRHTATAHDTARAATAMTMTMRVHMCTFQTRVIILNQRRDAPIAQWGHVLILNGSSRRPQPTAV
jgi:hypothetical protein